MLSAVVNVVANLEGIYGSALIKALNSDIVHILIGNELCECVVIFAEEIFDSSIVIIFAVIFGVDNYHSDSSLGNGDSLAVLVLSYNTCIRIFFKTLNPEIKIIVIRYKSVIK